MRALRRERGAALLIMITVVVLGFVSIVVAALRKSELTRAERDARTALALQKGKNALLSYVAHYAARPTPIVAPPTGPDVTYDYPGRMPCPESVNAYGTASAGEDPGNCSSTGVVIGRLPWKTLGIEQLRDGDGEPLWYVLGVNFRPTAANPSILNFSTPAALPFEGTNVVAVVIAPGRALASNPCNSVNQHDSRYATPLDPLKFFECGNATGAYANAASTSASNDRVLAITADEWAAAITGPIADRLQREVAPALSDFLLTESNATWGRIFLPYASTFTDPATNDLCGNNSVREGLFPGTFSAKSSCSTWFDGKVEGGDVTNDSCAQDGAVRMRCQFNSDTNDPNIKAKVKARARVGGSFRGKIAAGDITSPQGGWVSNFSISNVDGKSGETDLQFEMSFSSVTKGQQLAIYVPNLPDAAVVNDDRARWFFKNEWGRHSYYALSKGDRLDKADDCSSGKKADCMRLLNFPAANGATDDKHFILGLMGRALSGQTRPSSLVTNYLESRTGNSPDEYSWGTLGSTYNDRWATCPFKWTDANGVLRTLC